jgi:hypothetical protein
LVETNTDAVETLQNASRDRRDTAEDGATEEGAENKLEMEQSGQQVRGCLTPKRPESSEGAKGGDGHTIEKMNFRGCASFGDGIGKYNYRLKEGENRIEWRYHLEQVETFLTLSAEQHHARVC